MKLRKHPNTDDLRAAARGRRRRRLARTIAIAVLMAVVGLGFLLRPGFGDTPNVRARRVVVPASTVEVLPVPTPTPVPSPTPSAPSGSFVVAPGSSDVSGPGSVRRFVVEVEDGLGIDPLAFAREVEAVLWDERSWVATGRLALQRVSSGGSFRVTLASSETTRRLCRPLDTGRTLSCYQRGRSVLNIYRWRNGSPYFPELAPYRAYMINHEVGHALGYGHRDCPGSGALAPVMMQQTKGLSGCLPNAWPLPTERR